MPKRTRIDFEAVSRSLRQKLEQNFPIGCQVFLTRDAAKQLPRYREVSGIVVGYFNGVAPKVLWEGRKTSSSYHPVFVTRRHPAMGRATKRTARG